MSYAILGAQVLLYPLPWVRAVAGFDVVSFSALCTWCSSLSPTVLSCSAAKLLGGQVELDWSSHCFPLRPCNFYSLSLATWQFSPMLLILWRAESEKIDRMSMEACWSWSCVSLILCAQSHHVIPLVCSQFLIGDFTKYQWDFIPAWWGYTATFVQFIPQAFRAEFGTMQHAGDVSACGGTLFHS